MLPAGQVILYFIVITVLKKIKSNQIRNPSGCRKWNRVVLRYAATWQLKGHREACNFRQNGTCKLLDIEKIEIIHVNTQAEFERMNKYGSIHFLKKKKQSFFFFLKRWCNDRISHLREGFRQVLA